MSSLDDHFPDPKWRAKGSIQPASDLGDCTKFYFFQNFAIFQGMNVYIKCTLYVCRYTYIYIYIISL